MKKLILILSLSILSFAAPLPKDSVVKIFTISYDYKYNQFYDNTNLINTVGTGAIIEDKQILTVASLVNNAKFIIIEKENSEDGYYFARVKHITNQANLAILEVINKSFFNNDTPLKINENIKANERVLTFSRSKINNNIEIENAKINRIYFGNYVLDPLSYFLTFQLDRKIELDDSGSPVLNEKDEIIGLLMQKNDSPLVDVIPSSVINTFLTDIKDGKVDGFSSTSTEFSIVKNSFSDKYKDSDGVIVSKLDIDDVELMVNDIIFSINGKKISSSGIIDSKYGKIDFSYELKNKQIGDIVKLEIIRNDKKINVDYKIKYSEPTIAYESLETPRFINLGGLVFSPLNVNYLRSLNYISEHNINLIVSREKKTNEVSQRVVFNKDFKNDKVTDYLVTKVNNITIKDFDDFIKVVNNVNEKYIVIEFANSKTLMINAIEAKSNLIEIKDIHWINGSLNY